MVLTHDVGSISADGETEIIFIQPDHFFCLLGLVPGFLHHSFMPVVPISLCVALVEALLILGV